MSRIPMEIIHKSSKGGPLVAVLPGDLLTPVGAYLALAGKGPSFLLESVERGEKLGRYSFLGTQPESLLLSEKGRSLLLPLPRGEALDLNEPDPSRALQKAMKGRKGGRGLPAGLPPFLGGAVGFLSYEAVRYWERFPAPAEEEGRSGAAAWPDALFMLSNLLVAFDHLAQKVFISARGPSASRILEQAGDRLSRIPAAVRGRRAATPPFHGRPSAEGYKEAVFLAKEEIAAGEIIQAVPSRQFSGSGGLKPLAVYRALRSVNPSPYMFLLEFPGKALGRKEGLALAGSSPETMVRVQDGRAEIHPIAGSRPRSGDPAEDARRAEELQADPKERAEHLMLVDLARNDLGRICRTGSVRVKDPFHVEYFSHVMHLVSGVEGELAAGQKPLDALRAAFPAGTLTGAPKIRAMEIIAGLERRRRGPYGGAVGYLDDSGRRLDTAITIRTVAFQGRRVSFQAGAGVVADSDPDRELAEVEAKSAAMRRAIDLAASGIYG